MLVRWAAVLAVVLLVALPAGGRPGSARAEEAPAFLDPALVPAWELLLGVEVAGGRRLGAELAQVRDEAEVQIEVGPVPLDGYAQDQPSRRQVVVGEAIVGEDPRALAAVLAHEPMHVKQRLQGLLKPRDCAMLEALALAFQSDVWWTLTNGDMPTGTPLEENLTRIAGTAHRGGGVIGLYEALAAEPALGVYCAAGEG
jgi:hypothetical protein